MKKISILLIFGVLMMSVISINVSAATAIGSSCKSDCSSVQQCTGEYKVWEAKGACCNALGDGTCNEWTCTVYSESSIDCILSSCGDGICESNYGETSTCPQDCPTSTMTCTENNCNGANCDTKGNCAAASTCLANYPSSGVCSCKSVDNSKCPTTTPTTTTGGKTALESCASDSECASGDCFCDSQDGCACAYSASDDKPEICGAVGGFMLISIFGGFGGFLLYRRLKLRKEATA